MDRLLMTRRGLRREEAALYVGLKPTKFSELIADGRMPEPIPVDGCRIWDVRLLDAAFDELSQPRNDWDD